jgi:hypothetical protein
MHSLSPRRRACRAVLAVLAAGLLGAAPASADVSGPDDSIATAFGPLAPATLYSGTFKSDSDVDYLAFDVVHAGDRLQFDVTNTTGTCASPDLAGCPVYATLVDGAGQQLGGEGSGAGTGAVTTDAATDSVDWTFPGAGRFYVAMDAGLAGPSYAIRYQPVLGATPPPAGTPVTLVRATALAGGRGVRTRLTAGRALRAQRLSLQNTAGVTLPGEQLGPVAAGSRTITLRLNATGRRQLARHGSLLVRLRVLADPETGARQTLRRTLRLRAR